MPRWPGVSVLLVGAGTIGAVHGRAWARMEREGQGVQLVGVLDPGANGPRLAGELSRVHYRRWEDVPLDTVDVVDVAVPTPLHRPYVEAAAAAHRHVLCEKPLGRDLEDVEAIRSAVDRSGVRLLVGHVVRFFPAYRRAHDLIRAGELGAVGMVRTYRGGPFPRGVDDWYRDRHLSGGPLLDLAIHDFDFLLWSLGEPARVFAQEVSATGDPPLMHAVATVRFQDGALAQVVGSWAGVRFGTRFEVVGTAGLVTHDSFRDQPVRYEPRDGAAGRTGVAVPGLSSPRNPWEDELAAMLDALVAGDRFGTEIGEARAAIALALAAARSAATGEPVDLGDDEGVQA